ncbi:DUF6804 family protein [Cyclobacterium marinum]|uniref:Transmembrane protein n=1 Tax=Cyclobacterium marinum (strain ATCC 25205 / DSM 745 / LMG 13164 / NCIMB 1802) TaxID=880070 RepID=G0J6Q8_CYCMS|nr:DUF6804 family protein [Cyclobacterium marinum]AEL26106.1 hypothetical protein Cycma_2364 [Cyclobacterium marinum DSM 745]|tara:strand:- start:456 stop:767 length:312 start_codon:yes stop_codon:yes gene_type:complete
MPKTEKFIKIILSVLLLVCLLDMPYGYYQLIKFFGMVGFGILAYNNYKKNEVWFVVWLASAILINPIFKIYLGRELWNFLDVIWAILLITSLFVNPKKSLKEL